MLAELAIFSSPAVWGLFSLRYGDTDQPSAFVNPQVGPACAGWMDGPPPPASAGTLVQLGAHVRSHPPAPPLQQMVIYTCLFLLARNMASKSAGGAPVRTLCHLPARNAADLPAP